MGRGESNTGAFTVVGSGDAEEGTQEDGGAVLRIELFPGGAAATVGVGTVVGGPVVGPPLAGSVGVVRAPEAIAAVSARAPTPPPALWGPAH